MKPVIVYVESANGVVVISQAALTELIEQAYEQGKADAAHYRLNSYPGINTGYQPDYCHHDSITTDYHPPCYLQTSRLANITGGVPS